MRDLSSGSRRRGRRQQRSVGKQEEREKKSGWTKRRERECSLARSSVMAREKTYTHTQHTDSYNTKTLAPHATRSRDKQTLRPDYTQTEFDRSDLDSVHSTHNTRLDLGNTEKEQLNNRYSYRTESRMEVNDVTAAKDVKPPPLTTALTHIPTQRAGEVDPKTSVQGNT